MKVSEVDDSLLAIILQNIPFSVTTTNSRGTHHKI